MKPTRLLRNCPRLDLALTGFGILIAVALGFEIFLHEKFDAVYLLAALIPLQVVYVIFRLQGAAARLARREPREELALTPLWAERYLDSRLRPRLIAANLPFFATTLFLLLGLAAGVAWFEHLRAQAKPNPVIDDVSNYLPTIQNSFADNLPFYIGHGLSYVFLMTTVALMLAAGVFRHMRQSCRMENRGRNHVALNLGMWILAGLAALGLPALPLMILHDGSSFFGGSPFGSLISDPAFYIPIALFATANLAWFLARRSFQSLARDYFTFE